MVSCFCSVTELCPTLCDPMECSTPDFSVLHYLPEFVQTCVLCVNDGYIQKYYRYVHNHKLVQKHTFLYLSTVSA